MYMCVHKIMNMYIHGMYMVQTCMNRFAHLRGGGRIPDDEPRRPRLTEPGAVGGAKVTVPTRKNIMMIP